MLKVERVHEFLYLGSLVVFEDVHGRVKEATKNVRGNETILTFTKSTEEY